MKKFNTEVINIKFIIIIIRNINIINKLQVIL